MSLVQLVQYYTKLVLDRVARRMRMPRPAIARTSALGMSAAPVAPATVNAGDDTKAYNYVTDSGYFNIQSNLKFAPLLLNGSTRVMFYPLLAIAIAFWRGHSPWHALQLIGEHLYWSLTRRFRKPLVLPERSLRKVVNITKLKGKPNEDKMIPLRLGR